MIIRRSSDQELSPLAPQVPEDDALEDESRKTAVRQAAAFGLDTIRAHAHRQMQAASYRYKIP